MSSRGLSSEKSESASLGISGLTVGSVGVVTSTTCPAGAEARFCSLKKK